jgi:hypothetical protein
MIRNRRCWVLLAAAALSCAATTSVARAGTVIRKLDLSSPFHLTLGATLTATQGPSVPDPNYDNIGDKAPGAIRICVQMHVSAACLPDLDRSLAEAHYLEIAEIVRPRLGGLPLLHLQLGTLPSGDGSQGHTAVFLAYRPSRHRFERILEQVVGGNMNQQIRYVSAGPLRGAVIRVEPTYDRPYRYWVTVNRLTPDYRYHEALRYRSATIYGDGNPLAVIDSEMPNILRRLGLWRPGQPLPLPNSGCARARLVKSELWCS